LELDNETNRNDNNANWLLSDNPNADPKENTKNEKWFLLKKCINSLPKPDYNLKLSALPRS
jgi:hypothetical protein